MKKAILCLMIFCLCFSLCACCMQHEWVDATCTTPRTCAKCGETEGEALGHLLTEPTYHSPERCLACGAEFGTPIPGFFEANGIPVEDRPSNLSVNAVVANREKDPSRVEFPETKIVFKSYTVEPSAQRDGYETIKLNFTGKMLPPPITTVFAVPAGSLCDYYTGHIFAERSSQGDETIELFDAVTIDGTEYTLYYSKEIEWLEVGGWSYEDNATVITYEVTYLIDKPMDYDGLVFSLRDETAWEPYEENNDTESGSLEPADVEDHHFFRLGIA